MKKTKEKLLLVLLSVIFAFAMIITPNMQTAKAANEETTAEAEEVITDDFVDNEILVVMDELVGGINKVIPIDFFKDLKLNISKIEDLTLSTDSYIDYYNELDEEEQNFHQILKITLPIHSKPLVLKAVKALNTLVGVECAEPNYIQYVCESANDSDYTSQWGLNGEYGIDIENTWEITTGLREVRVGVIDTGIESDHPDLVDNLVEGKSFVSNVTSTTDTDGHGTHVAGIIGAVGDNGVGVSGVCKKVSLVPLRTSIDGGTQIADMISAVNYAKNLWGTAKQISILNYSSGGNTNSTARMQAIDNFPGLFVNAAGNDNVNIDVSPTYPASHNIDNMIVVGSHAETGRKSNFSNYGSQNVDISAPGSNILSTVPGHTYQRYNGTSMAAPFVAGVAALMLSVNPNLSAEELKANIIGNARIPNVNGVNPLEGLCVSNGILDAYNAVSSVALNVSGTTVVGLQENASRNIRYLNIPAICDGMTITEIGATAFNNCTKLESFYYDRSISIPSNALGGCTSLKTVYQSGGTSFGSGGLDTNWSYWREVAVLPILDYSALYANGKSTLQVNYNAYFSVTGLVSYQVRVSDYNNKQYAISGTYNSGNGQNHTRNCIANISDISSVPNGTKLRVQIRYKKQKALWGGHFTMTGKYLQLNIA